MRVVVLFACMLVLGRMAWAQELVLRHINEDLGLPSDCVLDLFVDHEGLLWVSTNKGLYRYDGFHYDQLGKGTALEEVNIVTIKEVPQLDMVLLAGYGMRLFIHRSDSLHEVDLSGMGRYGYDHGSLTGLVVDAAHRLHFGLTDGQGHWILDLVTEQVWEAPGVDGHLGRVEEVDGQPLAWIAAGLSSTVRTDSVTLRGFKGSVRLGEPCEVNSIFSGVLSGGRVWFSHCRELFVIDHGVLQRRTVAGRILGVTEDRNGRIWVRMWDAGLLCFDSQLHEQTLTDERLTGTHVTACVQDRQGGLWFGTIDRGLFQCVDPEVRHFSARDALKAPWASALMALPNGDVACGTGNGQLYTIGNGSGAHQLMDAVDLRGSMEVKGLMLSRDSVILPARLDRGWSLREHRVQHFNGRSPRWENIYAAAPLGNDRLLVATIMGAKLLELGAVPRELKRLTRARTYAVVPDRTGEGFLLGTHEGTQHLLLQDTAHQFITFAAPSHRTYDLLWAGDDLYIATARGLFLHRGGVVQPVPLSEDERPPQVRALAMQGDRWLWVATLNGLYRKDLRTPAALPARFGRAQGLPSESIMDVVVQPDRLWMICGPDVVSMPLSAEPELSVGAPLVILGITGNGELGQGDLPHFTHTVERVSIALRNHDFVRRSPAPFRYRTGPDAAWSFTASPEIQLVGLDPGEYRLEIQAVDAEGRWSAPVFARWAIVPPFWENGWFQLLMSLAGLALVFTAALYVRERRHREQRLAAEALRYHHKALLAQMEPHFIFNALNSIQGFVARNDVEASSHYLAKFAKLMRGLLNAAHNEQVTLAEELAMLRNYCDLESLRSAHAFRYDIVVDERLDQLATMLPAFLLQPYVENAIRHGLRNLPDLSAGRLVINFSRLSEDHLRIVVEDNGVGQEAAARVTEAGVGWRSHGTRINTERLELLRKQGVHAQSRTHTEDLKDEQGQALGTRVVIELPIILRKEQTK